MIVAEKNGLKNIYIFKIYRIEVSTDYDFFFFFYDTKQKFLFNFLFYESLFYNGEKICIKFINY